MKMETAFQNLWDAAYVVLRGKFIAIQAYLRKQTKNLKQSYLTPKGTRKRRTNPTKPSRRKENIKVRAEINKIETTKTIEKINESKSWSFEKVNKIDKTLASLMNKKREGPNK